MQHSYIFVCIITNLLLPPPPPLYDFFLQALTSIKDHMDTGSKDFIAAAEARGEKISELSSEFQDRVAIAYENTMMTADEFLTGILGKDYKDYFPKGMDSK
jgi:hypothetical protein